MDKPVIAWLVKATPWKDCPFDLKSIVVTQDGPDRAKQVFLNAFKNPALEITECVPVDVIKDEVLIDDKDTKCATA